MTPWPSPQGVTPEPRRRATICEATGPIAKEPAALPAAPASLAPPGSTPETRPGSTLARTLARSATAFVLTELVTLGLVLATLVGLCGWPRPTLAGAGRLALYSLAIGLGGGVAFAAAEVTRDRLRGARGLVLGLVVGGALAALVPLLGELALALLGSGTPAGALRALLGRLTAEEPARVLLPLGLFATVAVALHLPALVTRGSSLATTAWAMLCGGLSLGVGGALLCSTVAWLTPDALPLVGYVALLVPRCALVPLGLRLGDRLVDRLRRAAFGEEAVVGPAASAPAARPLGGRRAAQRHAARGADELEAGRPAEAALELEKALAQWPTAQAAAALAQARVQTGDLGAAAAALSSAATLARAGMPLVVDPRDEVWAPAHGHAAFDGALEDALAACAAPPEVGAPRAALGLLGALLGCLASSATLVLALAAATYPREVAEVTLERGEAWLRHDGARWADVGDRLRDGPGVLFPTAGLPDALHSIGLGHPEGEEVHAAALACYERAAALDDARGAREAARLLDQLVGRRKDAAALWRRGAERGDPESMREWARSLRLGLGIPSDSAAARGWAERAGAAGEVGAWSDLARWAAAEGDVAAVRSWLDEAEAAGDDVTALRASLAPE